jgi:hypothetical protein
MASSITSVGGQLAPHVGLSSLGQSQRSEPHDIEAAAIAPVDTVAETWRGERDAARKGLSVLALSAAAGRQAGALLDEIAAAAQAGQSETVQALSERLRIGVQSAIAGGASLLSGQALRLQGADAGASVDGLDLQFSAPPASVLQTPDGALAVGDAAAQSAREARAFADQWEAAQRRLSAHEGVLSAAAKLGDGRSVRDLDADGARLMALQVRQSLSEAGGLPIANGDPRAILALFKS